MEVPFLAIPEWAEGAGSLAATSDLVSQCPFILETEFGSREVGTDWSWEFSGEGLLPAPLSLLLTHLFRTGVSRHRLGEGTAGTRRGPSRRDGGRERRGEGSGTLGATRGPGRE